MAQYIEVKRPLGPYILMALLELLCIIFYISFTEYHKTADPSTPNDTKVTVFYRMYQDVHVMIFLGIGFLMTFLVKYSWSSVGFNFFIGAFAVQWTILLSGFFHMVIKSEHMEKIGVTMESLIIGDFGAGAVLISFGVLLGKVSLGQMTIIAFMELIFYSLNEAICVLKIEAIDLGGSMYIHAFGAYFGIACSLVLTKNKEISHKEDLASSRTSDLFSMLGTIFLWLYWPSFNAALAESDAKHRAVINSVLALTNSCIFTFLFSGILHPNHKFKMADIQNATLAGGVAMGTSADLVVEPYSALIIGAVAGTVSVLGYTYIQEFLEKKITLHDTCGVHNLHGMPGIIGAIAGAIFSRTADVETYGNNLYTVFPAMKNRSASKQASYQILALFVTLVFAIVGGLITSFIVKMLSKKHEIYFTDKTNWIIHEENPETASIRPESQQGSTELADIKKNL